MNLSSRPYGYILALPLALHAVGVEARPFHPTPAFFSEPTAVAGSTTATSHQASNPVSGQAPGERPDASSPSAPATLRLDTLLAELLARNPEIAARMELRDAEKTRERRAWAFPDPTVQIMGENFPFGSSMAGASTSMGETSGSVALPPMISYQVSQMFMFPGKRALMAREAAAGVEMARANLELSRQDLVAAGRRMFFDLYLGAGPPDQRRQPAAGRAAPPARSGPVRCGARGASRRAARAGGDSVLRE